jgi:hypothetical protein
MSPQKLKLLIDQSNGIDSCWLWLGATDRDGYPERIWVDSHKVRPYVFLYALKVGPIPAGFMPHHTCEIKRCVNPKHLKLLTRSDHTRLHNISSRCQRGHELTEDNTYITPSTGKRSCKTCKDRMALSYRTRRKQFNDLCSS